MNETAQQISKSLKQQFSNEFNQYIQIANDYPTVEFYGLKQQLWRIGMLVEIWSCIAQQQRTEHNG